MSDDLWSEFLDTNILVYAYDPGAGQRHVVARTLVDGLWYRSAGCLSMQVLQEFYVTGLRRFPRSEHTQLVRTVTDLAEWKVHSPTKLDLIAAIGMQGRYQISFWDAMMLQSATALGCWLVWSEDLNHGQQYGQVTVRNPFA